MVHCGWQLLRYPLLTGQKCKPVREQNTKTFKTSMDCLTGRHLQQKIKRTETLQQGAGGSITALQATGATGKPAIEDSAIGGDKLVVRHLPVVNIRDIFLRSQQFWHTTTGSWQFWHTCRRGGSKTHNLRCRQASLSKQQVVSVI
jgi:hypothetical protein